MRKWLSLLLLVVLGIVLLGCENTKLIEKKRVGLFHTTIEVKLFDGTEEQVEEIFNIYEYYHHLTSAYEDFVDINHDMSTQEIKNIKYINEHSGTTVSISKELYVLLEEVFHYYEMTFGYFNPLAGTLIEIIKKGLDEYYVPKQAEIEAAMQFIRADEVILENQSIFIPKGSKLDLGGFAKGYATEKVREYLEKHNIKRYLIDCGNSTIIVGSKPSNEPFVMGVRGNNERIIDVKKVKNNAIGTSGNLVQSIELGDQFLSHIVNPKTGISPNFYDSVVLIGPIHLSGLLEALTTTLMILDPQEQKEEYDAIIQILKENQIQAFFYKDDNLMKEVK